jgi:hypothetical protein
MRATLEVIAGPEPSRIIRLGSKELRSVGRTERADEALLADSQLSSVHFELETDHQVLRVRDLGSSNGTLVNGTPIGEYVLKAGDEITAGQTTFLVRIEGGASPETLLAAQATAAAAMAAAPRPPGKQKPIQYTVETCNSGLALFRGNVAEIKAAHVADVLARESPLHMTVDFRRLGEKPPAELPSRDYLFDWLPPSAAANASPLVIAAADCAQWFPIVEAGWGEDAVVCFFSKLDKVEVRAQLRREVRAGGDSIMGICWPSVLAPMLIYMRPADVEPLMKGIDAVLVELPDLPDTWQIFAPETFKQTLAKHGFVEEKNESTSTAT